MRQFVKATQKASKTKIQAKHYHLLPIVAEGKIEFHNIK